jgi:hypothetical protein
MRKITYLSVTICFLSLIFVVSCTGSQLGSDDYVKIPLIRNKKISIEELDSVKTKYNIDIPLIDSAPGSIFYAVVIQIDIDVEPTFDNGVYDRVKVNMDILERDGTIIDEEAGNIMIISAIPETVSKELSIEESTKIAGRFTAAVGEITNIIGVGDISVGVDAEQTISERYVKLYRIVTANRPTITAVAWTFEPFKDESIAGVYYLIALLEVSDQAHELVARVETNCRYSAPILNVPFLSDLLRQEDNCISGEQETIILKGLAAEPPKPSIPSYSVDDIVGMGIAGSDDHVYAWYKDGYVSSGTSRDLDVYRDLYTYSLPPGKSPGDIVGIAIAGSNDHVYAWYKDESVSSGTSLDLDEYRDLYTYSLPPGKSPEDIVGIAIAGSDDHVYAWYRDGTVSSGTSMDLGEYLDPDAYYLPSGKSFDNIVGIGIAGSNDYVYAWYSDGTVSAGRSISDLGDYRPPSSFTMP